MDAVEPGAMPDDWTELRRLAGEATPGPWTQGRESSFWVYRARRENGELTDGFNAGSDAAYIVAASPDRILRLLDERDRLKR